jgi:hypothetical protein
MMGKTLHNKIEDRSIKLFFSEKKQKTGKNARSKTRENLFRELQNGKTNIEDLSIDQKLCSTQIYLREIKECEAILSKQSKRLQLLGQLLLIHKTPNIEEADKLHLQNAIQRLIRQTDVNSSLLVEKEKFIFDKTSLEVVFPPNVIGDLKKSYIKAGLSQNPLLEERYCGRNFSRFIFSSFRPTAKIIEEISEETNVLKQFRANLSPINEKFFWTQIYWKNLQQNRHDSKLDISLQTRKEIVQLLKFGSDPPIF